MSHGLVIPQFQAPFQGQIALSELRAERLAYAGYDELSPGARIALNLAGAAIVGSLAYHGYKRNKGSVGWALAWGLGGGLVWPIMLPVAFVQGYGKPAKRK